MSKITQNDPGSRARDRRSVSETITHSAPPLDQNDRPTPASASAAPEPPFEDQHLRRGAEPEPQQGLRRQQRDLVAGGDPQQRASVSDQSACCKTCAIFRFKLFIVNGFESSSTPGSRTPL
jgi:hypothetical protein